MNSYHNRAVLVTGGAGFIGSHLVEELIRRNARVTVVDDLSTGFVSNLASVADQIDFRKLDLGRDDPRSLLAEGEFDTIFHLAGHANVPESVQEPRRDLEKNLLGAFNLIEAVRHLTPQTKVLFASSAAVYGESSGKPFQEDDPVVPLAPYGVSKLAAERYMNVYTRSYDLRTASLRLFPVYGPRSKAHVIYDLMCKISDNPEELFVHGDGTQVRDFTYVTDAVEAFLTIAEESPLRGEVYNVAAGEPISIGELAKMICVKMSAAPRFAYSGTVSPGVSHAWSADVSRLQNLGYRSRMNLIDGLNKTVAWFREEMKSKLC
ncbi:MAG: NAD-dependent epimerase/dehydratase family protein [Acidobacteriota bacterium]|nr:NAD-dependent epimerase/dehydratase family protein [Acidobacteriota bacterium]